MTQSYATLWHTKDELRFDKALKKRLEEVLALDQNKILNYISSSLLKLTHNTEIDLKEVLSPDLLKLVQDCKCYITGVDMDENQMTLDAYYRLDIYNNILIVLGWQSPIWLKIEVEYKDNWISLFGFFESRYLDKGILVPEFRIDFGDKVLFEVDHLTQEASNDEIYKIRVRAY
ncbi:MAG: hypothetical protein H7230_01215 [Candidatus Parcubacteria bacterium]|nr:hypothetical protein [Candidatus Paceibacterota bacterium]